MKMTSRKVDYKYPLKLAEIAKKNGVNQYNLISAFGANSKSNIFYKKIKGEVELAIQQLQIPSVHIYRPSLLLGNRNEARPVEKIAIKLMEIKNPLLKGGLKKYWSIDASKVGNIMVNQSLRNLQEIHIYPSNKIEELS
jgi:hypothetical protein